MNMDVFNVPKIRNNTPSKRIEVRFTILRTRLKIKYEWYCEQENTDSNNKI